MEDFVMTLSQITVAQLQSLLLWGAVLNYVILLLAFAVWVFAGDALYRLHVRWFPIERAQCHGAIYLMLGLYKLSIWLLFVIPWIALYLVFGNGATP
jgi:hypothetical protein